MTMHALAPAAPPIENACAQFLVQLLSDDSGQDMIEYALVAATIGLGTVAGVNGLAAHISNYFTIVDNGFSNAVGH
jgi:pilus assembly protein Flp/PilA